MAVQRFQQGNAVKRTIFEMIAQELLNMLPPPPADLATLNTSNHRRHDLMHENMLRDMPLSPRRVSSFEYAPALPCPTTANIAGSASIALLGAGLQAEQALLATGVIYRMLRISACCTHVLSHLMLDYRTTSSRVIAGDAAAHALALAVLCGPDLAGKLRPALSTNCTSLSRRVRCANLSLHMCVVQRVPSAEEAQSQGRELAVFCAERHAAEPAAAQEGVPGSP